MERRRFQDLLSPGGRIYHETHLAPLLRMQDRVREIALEIVTADDGRIPVLVTATLHRDDAGQPAGIRTLVFDATDRRRYEEELLRARRAEGDARARVERLQELTSTLAAGLDSRQIARAAVAQLGGGSGGRAACVLAEAPDATLRVLAAIGWPPAAVERWSLPVGSLATGEARFLGPGRPDGEVPAALPADERPAHLAVLPMRVGERLVGALLVGGEDDAPTLEERDFLCACATQCAQALERARLQDDTALAAERAAFIADMSQALEEARDLGARLGTLVEMVVPGLGEGARATFPGPGEAGPLAAATGLAPAEAGPRELVALGARDGGTGTLEIVRAPGRPGFARADRAFLLQVADRAALALETARLYEQERDAAHALQQSLLAGDPPADPRVEIATTYLPAVKTLEVGGDWFDAFLLGPDRIGVVVGDVVGRGLEAATAMGQLRSAVRALAMADLEPARLLDRLDTFAEPVEAAQMATLAYADIDLGSGRMRLAVAGHPPPVLVPPGQAPELVWGGRSTPVAAVTGEPREQAELVLEPGAKLLLYTDGLIERRYESLDRGFDRLLAEVGPRLAGPPDALLRGLTDVMLEDGGGEDDVSMLFLAFAGAQGEGGAT